MGRPRIRDSKDYVSVKLEKNTRQRIDDIRSAVISKGTGILPQEVRDRLASSQYMSIADIIDASVLMLKLTLVGTVDGGKLDKSE